MLNSPPTVKVVPASSKSSVSDFAVQPLANLESLPNEIFYQILAALPLSDIGSLCLTGSLLQSKVVSWIFSSACSRAVVGNMNYEEVINQVGYEKWINCCRQFGSLCKKATILHGTCTRLQYFSSWYSKFQRDGLSLFPTNHPWTKLMILLGLASAMSNLILGWDESEFTRIFAWILEQECTQGLDERSVFKMFFWEFIDSEDMKSCWLVFRLKTKHHSCSKFSMNRSIADKFYDYLAPCDHFSQLLSIKDDPRLQSFNTFQSRLFNKFMGKTAVDTMQELEPASYEEAKALFSDLGKGLKFLWKTPSTSDPSIVTILDSMFIGNNWLIDNRAACLLFSCEPVVKLYLTSLKKKKEGSIRVAHLLVSMVIVCGRLSNNLDGGMGNVLSWSFGSGNAAIRSRIIEEFWKEFVARSEDEDVLEDSLIQVGVFVGNIVYQGKNVKIESSKVSQHLKSEE